MEVGSRSTSSVMANVEVVKWIVLLFSGDVVSATTNLGRL